MRCDLRILRWDLMDVVVELMVKEVKKTKAVGEKKKREKKPPKEKPAAGEGKRKRAKKDKNAPKKGMSAYMFFLNSMREKVLPLVPAIPSFGIAHTHRLS